MGLVAWTSMDSQGLPEIVHGIMEAMHEIEAHKALPTSAHLLFQLSGSLF